MHRLDQALSHILNISAVSGFPWADTEKNGFTVIVTAKDRDDPASVSAAKAATLELAQLAWSQLEDFQPGLTPLEDCVAAAQGSVRDAQLSSQVSPRTGTPREQKLLACLPSNTQYVIRT